MDDFVLNLTPENRLQYGIDFLDRVTTRHQQKATDTVEPAK